MPPIRPEPDVVSRSSSAALWMWAEACDRMGEADRLQQQFFRPVASPASPVAWEPPADVYENAGEIVVVVAMPGVEAERMQIRNEPGVLIVRGSRPMLRVSPGHAVRRIEIPHGQFERRIVLPPCRLDLGAPELQQGCLVVHLRKLGPEGLADVSAAAPPSPSNLVECRELQP